MQMSNQFLTFATNILLLIISRNMVKHTRIKYCSSCYFAEQATLQKIVSSSLLFAAEPRLLPWKRGKSEGSWSLLSRAEAQGHLYVTAMPVFLFLHLQPATEKKIRLVLQLNQKPLLSPATAPKI